MMLDKDIANAIANKLKGTKDTVSVAESVTGGLLQAAFTIAKDASTFFKSDTTAYCALP